MAKKKDKEIIKIPVTLDDFKHRKMTQDWMIAFGLQPENLVMAKPLMDCMGEHFVLILVKVDSKEALEEALKNKEVIKL